MCKENSTHAYDYYLFKISNLNIGISCCENGLTLPPFIALEFQYTYYISRVPLLINNRKACYRAISIHSFSLIFISKLDIINSY